MQATREKASYANQLGCQKGGYNAWRRQVIVERRSPCRNILNCSKDENRLLKEESKEGPKEAVLTPILIRLKKRGIIRTEEAKQNIENFHFGKQVKGERENNPREGGIRKLRGNTHSYQTVKGGRAVHDTEKKCSSHGIKGERLT